MAPAGASKPTSEAPASKTDVDAEDAFVAKEQALRRAAANRCVIVVAGPPGGGKSTFIRSSLLPRLHKAGRRAALLQHKFAQEFGLSWGSDEWDDASRPVAFASVFDFGSGCVCCSPRGDVERAVRGFLEEAGKAKVALDTLVLETTGVADVPLFEGVCRRAFGRRGAVVVVADGADPPAGLEKISQAQRDLAQVVYCTGKAGPFYGSRDVAATADAAVDATLLALKRADPKRKETKPPKERDMEAVLVDPAPRGTHDAKCRSCVVLVDAPLDGKKVEAYLKELEQDPLVYRAKVACRTFEGEAHTAVFGELSRPFGRGVCRKKLRHRNTPLGDFEIRDPSRLFVLLRSDAQATASSLEARLKNCAAPDGYGWMADEELDFCNGRRVASATHPRSGAKLAVFFRYYTETFYARLAACPHGPGCDLAKATVLEDLDESTGELKTWRCVCEKHKKEIPIKQNDGSCVPVHVGEDGAIYAKLSGPEVRPEPKMPEFRVFNWAGVTVDEDKDGPQPPGYDPFGRRGPGVAGRGKRCYDAYVAARDAGRDMQGSKRERNSQLQRLISRPISTRFG
jgi:G3E family GTPase/nitrite reductase/ring-hydroxylating ferredoxin subunit